MYVVLISNIIGCVIVNTIKTHVSHKRFWKALSTTIVEFQIIYTTKKEILFVSLCFYFVQIFVQYYFLRIWKIHKIIKIQALMTCCIIILSKKKK